MDGWMDGGREGWMDKWMYGWKHAWIYVPVHACMPIQHYTIIYTVNPWTCTVVQGVEFKTGSEKIQKMRPLIHETDGNNFSFSRLCLGFSHQQAW